MWMRIFTMATLVTAFVMVLLVGYWLLWPYKILTDHDGNTIVDGAGTTISATTVAPGDPVIIVIHACKHYDLPETTSRELIDGFVYQLPTVQTFNPLGCRDVNIWVPIPVNTPPGVYRISTTAQFHPNPLRVVSYHWETNQFEVKRPMCCGSKR